MVKDVGCGKGRGPECYNLVFNWDYMSQTYTKWRLKQNVAALLPHCL